MVFELQFLDWLQTLQTTILNEIMKAVTHLGDAGALWIILAAVLLAFPKTRKSGAIVAAALIVDLVLCNGILKNIFARTRPFDVKEGISLLITAPKDFSFPSGHTAASFTAVAALYFAGEKKLWKECGVLAVLIAISRMYLYVHYPTDILGGAIIGFFCGWAGWKLSRYLIRTCKKRRAEV